MVLSHIKPNVNRNNFLDFVKGFLIILVVIGHAVQYAVYQDSEFWFDPLFKSIYMFHMPLFMAISGYLAQHGIKSTPFNSFIGAKIIAYVVPIFIWATLFQLALAFFINDVSFVSLPFAIVNQAVYSLWFLWALFFGLALTSIANSFGRNEPIILIVGFFLLLAVPDVANLHLIKYTFPYFLIGYYAGGCQFDSLIPLYLRIITLISGICACICFYFWDKDTYIYVSGMTLSYLNIYNIGLRYVAGIVVSIFAICILFYFHRIIHNRFRELIVAAGQGSIYIYILQSYMYMVIFRISKKFFIISPDVWLNSLISVSIGCIVALLSWHLGNCLVRNKTIAALLFGKKRK